MGEKKGFFSRLVSGLTKTRDNIVSGIDAVFGGFSQIDEDFYEEIEEILIMGDIGVSATENILESLKQKVKENHIKKPDECKELLIESIKEQMQVGETAYRFEEEKSVVLIVGVNGVGKTTSVGKLAGKLKAQGKKVLLAAADTFRAAAIEQLEVWGERTSTAPVRRRARHRLHPSQLGGLPLQRLRSDGLPREEISHAAQPPQPLLQGQPFRRVCAGDGGNPACGARVSG